MISPFDEKHIAAGTHIPQRCFSSNAVLSLL
jgi:hypothetical protein